MSAHRNQVLMLVTQTKLEILNAYARGGATFGYDVARRYVYEVAEAVALQEGRERASAMLDEIADATVAKLPLADAFVRSSQTTQAEAPTIPSIPKRHWWTCITSKLDWTALTAFFAGLAIGAGR